MINIFAIEYPTEAISEILTTLTDKRNREIITF